MAASADIYTERDGWSTPLGLSVALHGMLFASILIYGAVVGRNSGVNWGGDFAGGDAMSANLVSNIPLPRPKVQTENIVANESKGLTQSQPKAEEKPEPEAVPIPDKPPKIKPKPVTSKITPPKPVEPEPTNVVPFGQGGPVSGPYGSFNVPNAKGGFGVTGAGGDFGSRYAWYVRQVQQKVSQNWLKYEIDPNIANAQRVYITFDIDRNGRPTNIQVEQSSGIPSLDISATRALQRIDTFGALPNDYSGSRVSVEFWFDYRR
jgi:periplasmic protein TonB